MREKTSVNYFNWKKKWKKSPIFYWPFAEYSRQDWHLQLVLYSSLLFFPFNEMSHIFAWIYTRKIKGFPMEVLSYSRWREERVTFGRFWTSNVMKFLIHDAHLGHLLVPHLQDPVPHGWSLEIYRGVLPPKPPKDTRREGRSTLVRAMRIFLWDIDPESSEDTTLPTSSEDPWTAACKHRKLRLLLVHSCFWSVLAPGQDYSIWASVARIMAPLLKAMGSGLGGPAFPTCCVI